MRRLLLSVLPMLSLFVAAPAHAVDQQLVSQYSQKVVELICKGNREWLRCFNMDPLNCDGVSEKIVSACVKEHVLARTQPVSQPSEVMAVSERIHSCIQSSFRGKLDPKKKDAPECQDLGL
jgi:hypothetical protein